MEQYSSLTTSEHQDYQHICSADANNLSEVKDYAVFLSESRHEIIRTPEYLQIGKTPGDNSWRLYLSVVRQQADHFFREVLPVLSEADFSFRIPANSACHSALNDGSFGIKNVGKVVSVLLEDPQRTLAVLRQLIGISDKYQGVEIPSAIPLGRNVYVFFETSAEDGRSDLSYSEVLRTGSIKSLKKLLTVHDVKWPFKAFAKLKRSSDSRFVAGGYIRVSDMKDDAKGRVSKCIKLNSLYNAEWVLLKQGRRNQCFDDAARDNGDRMLWQYTLAKKVFGKIPTPRLIEHFESGGDHYLAFEFIEGIPLVEKVRALSHGQAFSVLHSVIKTEILQYLLQIAGIIDALQVLGLVHRDISAGNFLLTDTGKIFIIDLELSFDLKAGLPRPPFELGTPGYISPQQFARNYPAYSDDIYSWGALAAKLLTGLSPVKLNTNDPDKFIDDLEFHCGNRAVAALLAKCMHFESALRPEISEIKHVLDLQLAILSTRSEHLQNLDTADDKIIRPVIFKAVETILHGRDLAPVDRPNGKIDLAVQQYRSLCPSGLKDLILRRYLLSLTETLGYSDDRKERSPLPAEMGLDLELLKDAGIPDKLLFLALPSSTESAKLKNIILAQKSAGINFTEGTAGKGMCLLGYLRVQNDTEVEAELKMLVSLLIRDQEKDGSWIQRRDRSANKGFKITGFLYGVSGITCFLLEYLKYYTDPSVEKAVKLALEWLINEWKMVDGKPVWPLNSATGIADPWFGNGFTGIAYTFIRAYAQFSDPLYRAIATETLSGHPQFIQSNYFTVGDGLAGLGETYLEAFKIFGDSIWMERAGYIAEFLIHSASESPDSLYWLEGNDTQPRQSFMDGTGGIIHFLIHYDNIEKVVFPLQFKMEEQ